MLKTLARKELRESLPIIVLALLGQAFLVCIATGIRLVPLTNLLPIRASNSRQIPFIQDGVCTLMFLVACASGVAMGLWQTMRESRRGTVQFLFHRPVQREAILGVKIVVGAVTSLLVASLPVLCYALWAATPGTHASPFLWPMTEWAWQLCVLTPLPYLASFLSGIRPARWYGSRFLPILASLPLAIIVALPLNLDIGVLGWLMAIVVGLLICAGYILAIFNIGATRDFS